MKEEAATQEAASEEAVVAEEAASEEAPVAEEAVAEQAAKEIEKPAPAKTVSNPPDPAVSAPQHSLMALSHR